MPYIEYVSPPASGKTTSVLYIAKRKKNFNLGRKSLEVQSNCKKKLNFLGLPKEQNFFLLFKFFFSDLKITLSFFYDLKCGIILKIIRAVAMMYLIKKSRILASSKEIWLLDQGIHQNLVTCRAHGWLIKNDAIKWKNFFLKQNFAPLQLRFVKNKVLEISLYRRMSSSKIHLKQMPNLTLHEYVMRNVNAFKEIYCDKKN